MADMKTELKTRIRGLEKTVEKLDVQIREAQERFNRENHALQVTKEFYRLELERNGTTPDADSEQPEQVLFTMPRRFDGATIRAAALQILGEQGPMHVTKLQTEMEAGGRDATAASISSALIRNKEFERVPNKPNTFKLKE